MKRPHSAFLASGVLLGLLCSVLAGLVYFVPLHEPGALFYPFAALAFLGGPLVAVFVGSAGSRGRPPSSAYLGGGLVFAATLALFIVMYVVVPEFERTSVRLPAYCTGFGGGPHPAPARAYELPGVGAGVLITADERTAVVAMIDYAKAPYPTTVYVVSRKDGTVLRRMNFPNDTIVAAIDKGVVYLYDDKLGYTLDARTGAPERNLLLIDNYGGLSRGDRPVLIKPSGRHWYLETSAVISSWGLDGSVRSRPRLTMSGIAFNCFVDGRTGEVLKL